MRRHPERKRLRKRGYDYRAPGWYFVTLCVDQRKRSFGRVRDGRVVLSPIGAIARDRWLEVPLHFPSVQLDAFVIMPDHMHALLRLTGDIPAGQSSPEGFGRPVPGSLSNVIRSYKAAVTRACRQQGLAFRWQSRFHDRIVTTDDALPNIRRYIRENPRVAHQIR